MSGAVAASVAELILSATARAADSAQDGYEAHPIWPPLLYGALAVLLVAGLILLSHLLGERHRGRDRNVPYESGALPVESARIRFHAQYYLVAVFFLLFDLEAAFLFAWAIAFRSLGWAGYFSAVLFLATLALGLVFIWKEGALDWNRAAERAGGEREGADQGEPAEDADEVDPAPEDERRAVL